MIPLFLVASLAGGAPPSGTLFVDGGLTPSARDVVLPAAPSWASSVRLRVRHATSITFGWETDQYGAWALWTAQASIRAGWTLSAPSGPLTASRARGETAQSGYAVPFDGTLDWAGASGSHVDLVGASESEWVFAPVGTPLVLATRVASAWSLGLTVPLIPPSGGSVTWLNRTSWTAAVDYEFLP